MSCPAQRLCSPPSICSHRRGGTRGKPVSIPPAHSMSGSTGAEMLKSCILMRCCCATRAEQELLRGVAPGSRTCTAQISPSRLVPPPHTVPSLPEPARCFFCLIHISWWASHTFLIILPNICSQFVSNSSLCSSLPDSGRRVKLLFLWGMRSWKMHPLHPLGPAWGTWIILEGESCSTGAL